MYHKIDVSNFTLEQADDFASVLADELNLEVIGDTTFGFQDWAINADGPCIQHIRNHNAVYIRHIGRMHDVDRNNLIADATRIYFQYGLYLVSQENTENPNNTQFRFLR